MIWKRVHHVFAPLSHGFASLRISLVLVMHDQRVRTPTVRRHKNVILFDGLSTSQASQLETKFNCGIKNRSYSSRRSQWQHDFDDLFITSMVLNTGILEL